jgi:hypothetical protein
MQFFECLKGLADISFDGEKVRLPSVLFQPMAADDVASAVGKIAVGQPVNGIVEIGGPEQFRVDELVRRRLARQQLNGQAPEVVAWVNLDDGVGLIEICCAVNAMELGFGIGDETVGTGRNVHEVKNSVLGDSRRETIFTSGGLQGNVFQANYALDSVVCHSAVDGSESRGRLGW